MHDALDDPKVHKVVAMKSAQVAWTDGVLLNYIGRRIDVDPAPMIVMFAKDQAAKQFNAEKFVPMVEVTDRLSAKIDLTSRRNSDNRQEFKAFPGGFLKFVGSNSPSSVKSTPAPVVAVEEPDDANDNVSEQGDTITLLEERTKTFARRKVIFGGTPTVAGVSRVEQAYAESDQRKFFVPCHECGEDHVLMWENVVWQDDPAQHHEVYGTALPETARYKCPHCGALWTDAQRNANVRRMTCRAQAPFHGVAGFYVNELYSPFPGSTFANLVKKYLTAVRAMDEGDDTKIRAFRNNSEGLPYQYKDELPEAAALAERCEDYPEFMIPHGGYLVTMGVDVQHDRLAVIVRAWGRGMESWLLWWGEIFGRPGVPTDEVWSALDALVDRRYPHECGATLTVRSVSIDTGDGQTSDGSYSWARRRRGVALACKGSSMESAEIYIKPKESIDTDRNQKAYKYGLRPYIVGSSRAKDLLLGVDAKGGRIKLTGRGPGVLHWYAGIRADYFDQMLSEVKVPSRLNPKKRTWQKKAGRRNEALDAEILALHSAYHLKIHLMNDSHWTRLDQAMRQSSLLDAPAPVEVDADTGEIFTPTPAAAPGPKFPAAPKRGGFTTGWTNGRSR